MFYASKVIYLDSMLWPLSGVLLPVFFFDLFDENSDYKPDCLFVCLFELSDGVLSLFLHLKSRRIHTYHAGFIHQPVSL